MKLKNRPSCRCRRRHSLRVGSLPLAASRPVPRTTLADRWSTSIGGISTQPPSEKHRFPAPWGGGGRWAIGTGSGPSGGRRGGGEEQRTAYRTDAAKWHTARRRRDAPVIVRAAHLCSAKSGSLVQERWVAGRQNQLPVAIRIRQRLSEAGGRCQSFLAPVSSIYQPRQS